MGDGLGEFGFHFIKKRLGFDDFGGGAEADDVAFQFDRAAECCSDFGAAAAAGCDGLIGVDLTLGGVSRRGASKADFRRDRLLSRDDREGNFDVFSEFEAREKLGDNRNCRLAR